ncbi:MAG: hypothetical protein ACRC5T_12135, partial [Cetobacterium sp.]
MFKIGDIVKIKKGWEKEGLDSNANLKVVDVKVTNSKEFIKVEQCKFLFNSDSFELVEKAQLQIINLSELENEENELFIIKKNTDHDYFVRSKITNSDFYVFDKSDEKMIVIL